MRACLLFRVRLPVYKYPFVMLFAAAWTIHCKLRSCCANLCPQWQSSFLLPAFVCSALKILKILLFLTQFGTQMTAAHWNVHFFQPALSPLHFQFIDKARWLNSSAVKAHSHTMSWKTTMIYYLFTAPHTFLISCFLNLWCHFIIYVNNRPLNTEPKTCQSGCKSVSDWWRLMKVIAESLFSATPGKQIVWKI